MEKDHSHLIIGYLQSTLTKEDANAFWDWIEADPVHKKLFFETKAVYDACVSKDYFWDMDESWQRLLKKRQPKRKPVTLWKRIASYAAIALLAVGITSSFFIWMSADEAKTVTSRYIGGNGLEADIVVLADGTRISLGSKSIFYYESDFGQSERKIFLEGEAYFEVAPIANKPFIVQVNGQEIEALGTKFNVMAYPADSIFTTTLLEGSVRISADKVAQTVVLEPDQQFIFNRNRLTTKVQQVDASQYTSWTTGYYYFPEQRLESILHRLSHVYGIVFTVHSPKLNSTIFTGTFYRGQSIRDIMEIINLSVPIKYTIKDQQVDIYP